MYPHTVLDMRTGPCTYWALHVESEMWSFVIIGMNLGYSRKHKRL